MMGVDILFPYNITTKRDEGVTGMYSGSCLLGQVDRATGSLMGYNLYNVGTPILTTLSTGPISVFVVQVVH